MRPPRAFLYLKELIRGRVSGQLIIQFTDNCNARCPQCGMRVTEKFERSTLECDTIKRIIDSAARKGVDIVSFTGGEPLMYLDELVELINYAGAAGIKYIRTGTNGFMFRNPSADGFEDKVKLLADRLAATPLRNFWISVDSAVPSVHESMRGFPGVCKGMETALPIMHERGLYPAANLGINRNVGGEATSGLAEFSGGSEEEYLSRFRDAYASAFRSFYEFVIGLGFTIANTCYPMSIENTGEECGLDAVYAATAQDNLVSFSDGEKSAIFSALMDTVPRFRSRIRIFSPLSSVYVLSNHYAGTGSKLRCYPCRGGIDYFFINARDGNTYPCGYRGEDDLGKYWDLDIAAISPDQECRRCDWECFRDPSELLGPLVDIFNAPGRALRRFRSDPLYARLWLKDIRYYMACNVFSGRVAPCWRRLERFGS